MNLLAKGKALPNFIGLHFVSNVDKTFLIYEMYVDMYKLYIDVIGVFICLAVRNTL